MPPPIQSTLRDGTPVYARPLNMDDRESVKEGYRQLSDAARYHRFWTHAAELGQPMIERLLQADQIDHAVWGVASPKYENEPGLGAASYFRSQLHPDEAEFSCTVIDPYQRLGIGTLLLALLWRHGQKHGLKRMVGYAMPGNTKAITWLRQIGAEAEWDGYKSILTWELGEPSQLPDTPGGQALAARLTEFQNLPSFS